MEKILNRKIAPKTRNWDLPIQLDIEKVTLDNGLEIHVVDTGTQELMKIQGVFDAGSSLQKKPFVSKFTNVLLKEGSQKYEAKVIAEIMDKHGAYLNSGTTADTATISFYILNKHFTKIMPVVEDVMKHPVFPEEELEIYRNNSIQDYRIKQEKVNFIAKRQFSRQIYGLQHPYGAKGKIHDFDNIRREDLVNFQDEHYSVHNAKVIATGKIPKDFINTMNLHFGQNDFVRQDYKAKDFPTTQLPESKKDFIEKENAVQSAIIIGKPLINRKHEDYFDFSIMNTLLGGYFGSRLMKNIREDKGYTYGIGSRLSSLRHGGTFSISTQVGYENTEDALKEIYKEIDILQNELVGEDELETVKNYIIGQMLRSVDGLFSIASMVRNIVEYDLDSQYINRFIQRTNEISAEEIRTMAQKYLALDSLHELVVGRR